MMKKIFLACVFSAMFAFGAGNAEGKSSEAILPQKAEYEILQILVGGKTIKANGDAIFGVDGARIYGKTGCNNYFTDFVRVDGVTIEVSTNGGATKMMCDRESMEFERVFLQNLVGVFSVVESSEGLNLKGEKMEILLKK